MAQDNKIVFDTWAEAWQQGCLLGNGSMGQVLYGRPGEEIVELSHVAFFSGSGNVDPYPGQGREAFAEAREAARKGDFEEVYRQTGRMMGKRGNYGTNLPVGKLRIRLEGEGAVSGYGRFLDLDRGLAGCEMVIADTGREGLDEDDSAAGGGGADSSAGESGCARQCVRQHKREAFTSHPDKLFAYYLEETDVNIAPQVTFDGGRNPFRTWEEDGLLCFQAQALETVHSDGTEGAWLCGAVKVCVEGSRAVLYLAMDVWTQEEQSAAAGKGASVELPMGARQSDETETKNQPEEGPAREKAWQHVKAWVNHDLSDYDHLRDRHVRDVESLMGRQRLRLGRQEHRADRQVAADKGDMCSREESLCASQLLDHVRQGGDNRRLTELMYQYGRYLLLSSSRQDSPLPAHLQGVWNDDVACQIGWTCDMHLDINTQMNYWISEPGNLGECHEPLFDWMERRLIPNGRLTAQKCYGYPGWVGELVSNAWGYAAPYWNESLSPCPTGGIWQASDYLEHYRYGQDRAFLEKRVLPVIGEAVAFFLEYLTQDDEGYLVGGPSISPENAFLADGKKYYASLGCTYEMVMIRELFLEYVEICQELGIGGQQGAGAASGQEQCGRPEPEAGWAELLGQVEKSLPRLLPYRILPDGALAEWSHDYPAADLQHRHTSHLLGLFPYSQITPEETPRLARAAATSIQAKLTPYENWEDTGWARSMLALYSARLQDAAQTYRHLRSMQTQLTGSNLLVMHPPTRGAGSFMEVYELDGNTGFAMAVMEALVQSHGDCIRLLPALPDAWPEGCLEGAVLRGGITLDLYWEAGRPARLVLRSAKGREVALRHGGQVRKCHIPAGGQIVVMWDDVIAGGSCAREAEQKPVLQKP